jgi:hypothetical protein
MHLERWTINKDFIHQLQLSRKRAARRLYGLEDRIGPISERKKWGFFSCGFEPIKMKAKSLNVMIWFLSLGGIVGAQQEKGQEDMAGTGQSTSEYHSYMGGKEHYLANSPSYMAGKKHYLQGEPSADSRNIAQGNEQIAVQGLRWDLPRRKSRKNKVEIKLK